MPYPYPTRTTLAALLALGLALGLALTSAPAAADTPAQPDHASQQRVATLLLTLSNPHADRRSIEALVAETVRWAAPGRDAPRVLVVRDDNHNGEFEGDARYAQQLLNLAGARAVLIDEPAEGLNHDIVYAYDVVWFVNPGHPIDDLASIHMLAQLAAKGVGVVLQGDDIAQGPDPAQMEALTGLRFLDNGTQTCDRPTDNNRGEVLHVRFAPERLGTPKRLADIHLRYGDDIDHTKVIAPSARVLAWAQSSQGGCRRPAVVFRLDGSPAKHQPLPQRTPTP